MHYLQQAMEIYMHLIWQGIIGSVAVKTTSIIHSPIKELCFAESAKWLLDSFTTIKYN